MRTSVKWIDARVEVPDDDMTVLIALSDGYVWLGYHDAGVWRYVSGDDVKAKVTFWANLPYPPKPAAARNRKQKG